MNWYLLVLRRYFVFQGRASRPEFWWSGLVSMLICLMLSVLDGLLGWVTFGYSIVDGYYGFGLLANLYSLAVLTPSIAVAVRRLHDTERSAWWLLFLLIPFVGSLVLLVLMVLPGSAGENRYGPVPVSEPVV